MARVNVIDLSDEDSLDTLIKKLTERGVTDFSKVRVCMRSESCNTDHGGGYCYCPTQYSDIRLEWKL